MNSAKKLMFAMAVCSLFACGDGKAEKAGEKLDNAVDETQQKADEVCDEKTKENC